MVEYIVRLDKPYDIGKALHYCNAPNCEVRRLEPHGRLVDEEDLRNRAYAIQRRDGISFPDALALALTYAPTILEAST